MDHGTYPYVTSSHSLPSGVWSGSGVPARHLTRIIGVVKAYTTRVGRGPFPTELDDGPDGIGERIRKIGREYGTVTGRPRRVGWFDAVAARYTAMLAGADEVTVMLLDVLSGLDELKICTAYELDGERRTTFPGDAFLLERCRPVYETLPGWKEDLTGSPPSRADLPAAARRYVDRIAELVGLPVSVVSVGPDREQTIRSAELRRFQVVSEGHRMADTSRRLNQLVRTRTSKLCRATSPSSWTATAGGPASAAWSGSRATSAGPTRSAGWSRNAAGSASGNSPSTASAPRTGSGRKREVDFLMALLKQYLVEERPEIMRAEHPLPGHRPAGGIGPRGRCARSRRTSG